MKTLCPIPALPILFEDECVLAVDKPAGMLSQPGKVEPDSVVTRVLDCRPEISGPALVHRLDMDTSGILLLGKTRHAHRVLQQQFENRLIGKRYRAVLESQPYGMGGKVDLPLRLDTANRPRQIVCKAHGKRAVTLWRSVSHKNSSTVFLFPLTGRTHQLRVHMASVEGMGVAIAGDRLYGHNLTQDTAHRLMLHAEYLRFIHPVTQRPHQLLSDAAFPL
ncbi:MAG: RluA family pseudouridine synthase [Granulosicoccus sp.]|nr:RluA family pseudouridine synthase [Granulosicoccus sp.]